ncbi:hypothetical protein B0H14DRAFT_2738883 [Mycena olivaceomarginata]|nr:hypothetical protein B0H14DRAFT_2738883 [Mycena olivaceomarginata]
MLLGLSAELLEEIGSQLPRSDHANLRTVCRDLNGAMHHLFFSLLVLKTGEQAQSDDGIQILKAIANGGTGWSLCAKTLCIRPGAKTGNQETESLHDSTRPLLASALAAPSNIRTVVWNAHENDSSANIICDFLNTITTLETLELDIQGLIDFSSLHVSGVQNFTIKSPSWRRRWRVNTPNEASPAMYQELAALVSHNQPKSLHLDGPREWSKVWSMLRTSTHGSNSRIKLTKITTSVVTPELFDYLSSYSGIEKLTLKFPDGGNEQKSDLLADTFFDVLPRHAASLTEFSCPAAYQSRFSFGIHNVTVVSLLRKLTKLEMSVNAGAIRKVDKPRDWVDANGIHHALLSVGVSVEADQADIDSVVTLLLETAAALPALRSLTILSAETERNRGAWCGNGRIRHRGAVDLAIKTAVKTFRSNVACSAIVRAGYETYELQPTLENDPDGVLGYHQTGVVSRR